MDAERPDPKVLAVWRWSNAVTYAILSVVLAIPALFAVFKGHASVWWLLLILVVPCMYGITAFTLKLEWESWTFRITPLSLEMSHGWLYRKRRVVALDRIQHVDINS